MKELLGKVKDEITRYGYRKSKNSFWKIEDGFYKLIDFQHGAFGEYFFVNIGLHPVGLPAIITGKLEIKERPREYECIIRQRIEKIVPMEAFSGALVSLHDENAVRQIIAGMPAVERWLDSWGSFRAIAGKDFSELSKMMPAAPVVWRKAFYTLKCYCMLKQDDLPEARRFFLASAAENGSMDFSALDHYMETLLDGSLSAK